MCTSRSEPRALLTSVVALATTLAGCDPDPLVPRFGVLITNLEFNLFSENMGIHPFDDVIGDPANPFRETGVSDEAKFQILEAGGNVATFYAWATLLAFGPNGEAQFYAAVALENMTLTGEVEEADRETVRDMARRAYRSVLVNFPRSVTFAASGIEFFRLATPAYEGIVRLGGIPPEGWVLVPTVAGGREAIFASGSIDGDSEAGGGS